MKFISPSEPNIPSKEKQSRINNIEKYVSDIRISIIKDRNLNISLLRQENYDYTDDEIILAATNVKSFFDSKRFIRLLEETYNVNIYIFSYNEEKGPYLEIPRHKVFSAKNLRQDRATIILYKNFGPSITRKNLEYPSYELIVNKNSPYSYFGTNLSKLCHELYMSSFSIYTFTSPGQYMNLYHKLDYEKLFGNSIIEQYIDGYGRASRFNLVLKGGVHCTVITHPVQPFNLPIMKEVYLIDIQTAFDVFGKDNLSEVVYSGEIVLGLWFKVSDVKKGFYVVISGDGRTYTFKSFGTIDLVPSEIPKSEIIPLHLPIQFNDIKRYKNLKRTLSTVTQLIEWCFDTWRLQINANGEFHEDMIGDDKKFIEKTFSNNSIKYEDSQTFYSFVKLGNTLPSVTDYKDCLEYIESAKTNLVKKQKFVFHSKEFTEKMKKHLAKYLKENFMLKPVIRESLKGFFTDQDDFNQPSDVKVFIGDDEFTKWRHERNNKIGDIYTLVKKLDLKYSLSKNPYIYEGRNSRFYLIQNTKGSKLDIDSYKGDISDDPFYNAISVAVKWNNEGINYGYDSEDIVKDISYRNALIYKIDVAGEPYHDSTFEYKTQGVDVEILQYIGSLKQSEESRFAAFLTI